MEMMLYCYSWPGNWKKARHGRTGDHRYMLEHSNKISHPSSEEARSSVSKTCAWRILIFSMISDSCQLLQ
jgi:hypothetical protein